MINRRTRRSHTPAEALRLLLESQRAKLGVAALAVTTRDGRVLGAVGRSSPRGPRATWELRAGDLDVVVTSQGRRLSHELGAGVKRILESDGR